MCSDVEFVSLHKSCMMPICSNFVQIVSKWLVLMLGGKYRASDMTRNYAPYWFLIDGNLNESVRNTLRFVFRL